MTETNHLPGPIAQAWEWQYEGRCRGLDSTFFFHPDGERGSARRRRESKAKAICAQCPVLSRCREHSIMTREPYGVWGGLSEDERHSEVVARERRALRIS